VAIEIQQICHLKALRLNQVIDKTGLSRSSIYAKAKLNEFPTPIKLGSGTSSAWLEHEVDNWLNQQILASRRSEDF
jgi:prophage regulatory protein